MLLDSGRIDSSILKTVHSHSRRDGLLPRERRLPERPFTAHLPVHGEGSPFSHDGNIVGLTLLQKLDRRLRRQTLIIIIIHLNHRSVGTGTEALHFQECEHAVRGGLAVLDAQVVLDGSFDILGAADHAGCGAAELDEVLSYLGAVEHGVETGDFVDAGGGRFDDLGDLVHGGDGEPSAVLALC